MNTLSKSLTNYNNNKKMNIGKSYFIYIIKPTLMITTFLVNFQYSKKSEFPNEFYLILSNFIKLIIFFSKTDRLPFKS